MLIWSAASLPAPQDRPPVDGYARSQMLRDLLTVQQSPPEPDPKLLELIINVLLVPLEPQSFVRRTCDWLQMILATRRAILQLSCDDRSVDCSLPSVHVGGDGLSLIEMQGAGLETL